MNDILTKYNSLSPDIQKEVNDFLDFLMSKHKDQKQFDMKSWKSKVKNLSTWKDEDLKGIEEGVQQFNLWKPEKW